MWGKEAFRRPEDSDQVPTQAGGSPGITSLRELDFVVANPPASSGDDGFSYRRQILREAREVLKPGGLILMQWLSYYGQERIEEAVAQAPGVR